MSFLESIEKLRNKPESSRKRIAIIGAFLVTIIIAIIWLSVVFVIKKEKENKTYHSPFSVIKEVLKSEKQ